MNAISQGRMTPGAKPAGDADGGVRLTMEFDDLDEGLDPTGMPLGKPSPQPDVPPPPIPADREAARERRPRGIEAAPADNHANSRPEASTQPGHDDRRAPAEFLQAEFAADDAAPAEAEDAARAMAGAAARSAGKRPPPQPEARSRQLVPSRLSAIEVTLSVELGRRQVALRDLMTSEPGQLFTLDQLTSEPVEILVNGRLFATGEVVAVGDQFGVRLTALVEPEA